MARNALLSIHTASGNMNKQLTANEMEAKNIAMNTSAQLRELMEQLLPMRAYASKSWHSCMSEIEKSDYVMLKKIIVSYQQYSRAIIEQFIKQDRSSIENIISNCQKSLNGNLEKINQCNSLLQAILDHKNPYVKEDSNVDVIDMDVALAAADTALACMNEMTAMCSSVKSMSVDLLNINLIMNQIFYGTLYETLKKDKELPIALMFDENGLIAKENQDEVLPAVENNKITINKKHYTA